MKSRKKTPKPHNNQYGTTAAGRFPRIKVTFGHHPKSRRRDWFTITHVCNRRAYATAGGATHLFLMRRDAELIHNALRLALSERPPFKRRCSKRAI